MQLIYTSGCFLGMTGVSPAIATSRINKVVTHWYQWMKLGETNRSCRKDEFRWETESISVCVGCLNSDALAVNVIE